MLDQTNLVLQYLMDATEAILRNPDGYDERKVRVFGKGEKHEVCLKYIYQGTGIRYTPDRVWRKKMKR